MIDCFQIPVPQRVDFQFLAVGEDAQIALGMLLVADIPCELVVSFGTAGIIKSPFELENQIAVKGIRISAANPQGGDVLFQENRLGLLQPRKNAAQELQEHIANRIF